jgi:hypothetical protein
MRRFDILCTSLGRVASTTSVRSSVKCKSFVALVLALAYSISLFVDDEYCLPGLG